MKVRYIGKPDTPALEPNTTYELLFVENGWYRIVTELGEEYLLPPEQFELVRISKEEGQVEIRKIWAECNKQSDKIMEEAIKNGTWKMGFDANRELFADLDKKMFAKAQLLKKSIISE